MLRRRGSGRSKRGRQRVCDCWMETRVRMFLCRRMPRNLTSKTTPNLQLQRYIIIGELRVISFLGPSQRKSSCLVRQPGGSFVLNWYNRTRTTKKGIPTVRADRATPGTTTSWQIPFNDKDNKIFVRTKRPQ